MIDWFLRTIEIIDKYQPQVLWFDWWIEQPAFEPWLRQLAAYYYNRAHAWQRGVVVQYKYGAFRPGTAIFDIERGALDGIHPMVWQNDTSVARNSWSYVEKQDYKPVAEIIAELVDVVAKNGVLLLNIGPRADGTIAEPEQELLRAIGRWLGVHGEAIYGARPWRVAAEGPTDQRSGYFTDASATSYTGQDIRFTCRQGVAGDFLYATALAWPDDGQVAIRSLGRAAGQQPNRIEGVDVLGHTGDVRWTLADEALVVELPDQRPSEVGVTVRVRLADPAPTPRHEGFH